MNFVRDYQTNNPNQKAVFNNLDIVNKQYNIKPNGLFSHTF